LSLAFAGRWRVEDLIGPAEPLDTWCQSPVHDGRGAWAQTGAAGAWKTCREVAEDVPAKRGGGRVVSLEEVMPPARQRMGMALMLLR
jgi:hypothetical protein